MPYCGCGHNVIADLLVCEPYAVDLVEHAAISKMGFLRLLPAAENLVDGVEFHLGQFGRDLSC